jgi:hypothetical protein
MNLKYLAISAVVSVLFTASCKEIEDDQKNQESFEVTDSSAAPTVMPEEHDVSYNLPSALQIAYVFKKSGASFIPSLLNSKSKAQEYNTNNYKRAVNFGIYSADLAYCLFSKKYEESKEYLKACKETGSFLGLNQAFESDNIAQRFDKNISNEDSVVKIVSNVQLKTDLMLEQNQQKHITVIAFAGAWVESLHIALAVNAKEKNKKILGSVMEQLALCPVIIKALKNHNDSEPEIGNLIASIEEINGRFNSIEAVQKSIESDEEIDFNTLTVADSELNVITDLVKNLRAEMIK